MWDRIELKIALVLVIIGATACTHLPKTRKQLKEQQVTKSEDAPIDPSVYEEAQPVEDADVQENWETDDSQADYDQG